MPDGSVAKRKHSQKIKLLALIYDHSEHKYKHGFSILTLGRTDKYIFVPIGFNTLSSANNSNRYQEISITLTNEPTAMQQEKTSYSQNRKLLSCYSKKHLIQAFFAYYILMDTWFYNRTYDSVHSRIRLGRYGMVK